MTADDFLARLDAALGCQQCGGPLGGSPDPDWCGQDCQREWHAARTVPLPGVYSGGFPADPWPRGRRRRPAEQPVERAARWADVFTEAQRQLASLISPGRRR